MALRTWLAAVLTSLALPGLLASAKPVIGQPIGQHITLTGLGHAANENQSCTRHIFHAHQLTFGPTRTVWTTTETATSSLDCGGCSHLTVDMIPLGVPPVVIFKETTTLAQPTTTTVFCCATSLGPEPATGYRPTVPPGQGHPPPGKPTSYYSTV